MSKFFEALERAETEQALQNQAASPPRANGPSASPPLAPRIDKARPNERPSSIETRPTEKAPSIDDTAPPAEQARPTEKARPIEKVSRARSARIDEHLVSLLSPASFEAEAYRVLRHVIETQRKSANFQVVAVTSPGVGEGKTTTAINLAGALAQAAEARVLLADVDLRRPTIGRDLGLSGSGRSLVNVLLDPGLGLEDAVEHLPRFNLSVLPAGPAVAFYELLKSPRLEWLIEEARKRYDYIVLDTPPFVPVPDGRLIAKCADGFLIVVAAHRTSRAMLAETLDLVDPAKVMGLVFNGDDVRRSSYSSYYAA